MKNKASQTDGYSGIKIVNSINMTVPKTKIFINKIPLIIDAFLGIFGLVFSFFTMFKLNINSLTMGYLTFLFFLAFTIIFMLPHKFHLACIPILILYGLLLYKKWSEFVIGYKLIFNEVYRSIYPNARKYFNIKTNNPEHIELFCAFVIFLAAAIICYCVYVRPNFFISFIVTFPIIEAGLYYGKSPSIIYMFMLIIFWLTQIALTCCGYNQNIKKNSSGFIRRNSNFIAKPGIKFNTAGLTISVMALICAVIFAITALLSNLTGYERSEKINTLRSDLKLAANEFSMDNFDESMERFSTALGIGKNKIYTHKLGNVGALNFKNTSEITVTTGDKFDSNIYLKGYTGAVYEDAEWKELSQEVYNENREMFNSFKNENDFPQDMLTNYFSERYDTSLIDMNIKSEYKNEKYNYTPYISIPYEDMKYVDDTTIEFTGNINYIDDTSIEFKSKNDYSFKVNPMQISPSNFPDILSGLNYSINESELNYEYYKFVMGNYIDLPYTTGLEELRNEIFSVNSPFVEPVTDIYKRLEDIREYLAENAEYSLKPGRTPDSEDFVNYFLLQNHKGFCVHFATAGVVLARMSGIPARYAEGYVVRASDFNEGNLNDDDSYTIDIKDNRAHAWAEIYISNLGWVPFEFTPPSAAALEEAAQTETAANTNSKTTKTTISKKTKTTVTKMSSGSNSAKNSSSLSITTNKKTSSSKDSYKGNLKLSITILFILFILAALAFIILKHFIIINRRKDIFDNSSPKIKITCAYECILKLIEYLEVEKNNMQYLEFAEYAQSRIPDIIDNNFKEVTEIMLKAQMSNIGSEQSEANLVVNYYKTVFNKIYNKSNIFKKMYIKFLKNL